MRNDDDTLGPGGVSPARSDATRGHVRARRAARGRAVAGLVLSVGLVATACTSGSDEPEPKPSSSAPGGLTGAAGEVRAKMLKLTNFDSCDALLTDFRAAAMKRTTGSGSSSPTGRSAPDEAAEGGAGSADTSGGQGAAPPFAAAPAAPQEGAKDSAQGGTQPTTAPGYSGTNVHEQGVDEPDLVKTDGRRVLTVADGQLRVVDVATRTQTGVLSLPGGSASEMLLSGDRVLLIMGGGYSTTGTSAQPDIAAPTSPSSSSASTSASGRARLVLVDLSSPVPTTLGELTVDGGYVDARQIGATARVVIRSQPRGPVVQRSDGGGDYRSRYNQALEKTTVDDWLPSYTLKSGGSTNSGRLVDCSAVSRPETEPGTPGHTGVSTLSVLSFDLNRDLGTGGPVTVAADADTVYASASNLYVTANYQTPYNTSRSSKTTGGQPRTAIYQFDISGNGAPKHVASGDVDGALLNQYSLSEYGGHLRVATTSQQVTSTNSGRTERSSFDTSSDALPRTDVAPSSATESAVTVLALGGPELRQVGRAGGLGRGERIYAVRFTGAVGYVVTFRQTDPLYTLDLSDPASPKVLGELKINGYSAYLHPIDGGQLIGVGQDATDSGRRTGTQVSLFDVGNLTDPRRIANYTVTMGGSEAEMDPHAFLYWPETGTLVIPLQSKYTIAQPAPAVPPTGATGSTGSTGAVAPTYAPTYAPASQALVLKLRDGAFTEAGTIAHPNNGQMRRSLVIGDALWTVSTRGVMVSDLNTLAQRAWVPFA